MKRVFRRILLLALIALSGIAQAAPSVALHYGKKPPLDELSVFDIVVVEPDHVAEPAAFRRKESRLYAYVSVGEVHPSRAYAHDLPDSWKRGIDPVWKSVLVDVSQAEYAGFFADRVIGPLWQKGYRGFFLDTMDSYRRIEAAEGKREAQDTAMQEGLVRLVEGLHARFPGIRLIANRGFELLPKIAPRLEMIAAESVLRGHDSRAGIYLEVSEADRAWLLERFSEAREKYQLPGLAIDYVPAADRSLARQTAAKIRDLGLVPWVTEPSLETVGIGAWEVLPRRVMMVYDGSDNPVPDRTSIARIAAMPVEYHGYVPEFIDLNAELPAGPLAHRYAGIVVWPDRTGPRAKALADWVRARIGEGMRVAFLGQFGFPIDDAVGKELGLVAARSPSGPLRIVAEPSAAGLTGFESRPTPTRRDLLAVRIEGPGRPIVTISDPRGERYTGAAVMPWGGFALNPFVVAEMPGGTKSRWVINPFAFLAEALALPPMPAPDVTTENGRRLFFIHIDGDGFPSRAELPGNPFAGAALRDLVLKRYRLPTTMSIIEGEISPEGLHGKDAAELEGIARNIFALPYVEIASHTFSHPFYWYRADGGIRKEDEPAAYHLEVSGYALDLRREIEGSIAYIRDRLAPPGKPVEVFLWSGDAEPTARALAIAESAGLLNMNGGNTRATKGNPSITAISSMGVERGGIFQTYAPIMNENVYTNLWTGPYYGFENVIETFELTGAPRRLKPLNLYYHTYSASKKASLGALERIYAWALGQSPHVIYGSDYIRKARDFRRVTIAREVNAPGNEGLRFRIRGEGHLRTLRLPARLGPPELATSRGVAGHSWRNDQPEARYLHLTGGEATVSFINNVQEKQPDAAPAFLFDANARIEDWQTTPDGLRFTLHGHQPLEFSLANIGTCRLAEETGARSRLLAPKVTGPIHHFRTDHAAGTFALSCPTR